MTKSMVHRALTTLVDEGYLMRDPAGSRYQLGLRVIELQNPNFAEPDLRSLSAPYIRRLNDITGETVRVATQAGDTIVIVDGLESRRSVASRVGVGSLLPLHISPASRVILACLPDDQIEAYIRRNSPLRAATPTTITDPAKLREDIRLTRQRGYALGYGDASPGAASVAFPIRDSAGRLHGSVVVVGPEDRFRERLTGLLPAMQEVVEELNRRTRLYSARPASVL